MRFARLYLAAAVALMLAAHASAAWAVGWSLPVSGGTPALGFGVQYAGGTHRGVDLEVPAGADVVSPTGGTVTFAGRIPADGGGTCGAVTIELADGHRVSLLPLEGVCVATGDGVDAGDALGSLAATGDDSSASPHLHVGLRSGELYLDPMPFLPCCGAPAAEPVPEAPPVTVPDPPAATSAGVAATAPAATAAPVVGAAAPTPASVSAVVQAEVAPTVPAADAATPVTAGRPVSGAELPAAEAAAPNNAPHTVSKRVRVPFFSARPVTSGILALGMLATGIAIVRVRRASPVHVR